MAEILYKYGFKKFKFVDQQGGNFIVTNQDVLVNLDLVRYAKGTVPPAPGGIAILYFSEVHNVAVVAVNPIATSLTKEE